MPLRCSCGNQKQMNSPVNLPPQNSDYITQPGRALTPVTMEIQYKEEGGIQPDL